MRGKLMIFDYLNACAIITIVRGHLSCYFCIFGRDFSYIFVFFRTEHEIFRRFLVARIISFFRFLVDF